MWKCESCGKVFQHYVHVAQHRRIHTKNRPFKCKFGQCIQVFHNFSELQKHYRAHLDHRRFYCGQCGVCFLHKSHLKQHACQQSVPRVYKCHVCSATFFKILSLANHLHEQHPRRRKACLQNSPERQKRNSTQNRKPGTGKADDSKILLKISSGKSMTIISPSRKVSDKSEKKNMKRKLKKKHRKDNDKSERQGIILSIKKGMVNVTDKRTDDSKQSENKTTSNMDYKVGEKKSELKLTIKALPELSKLKKVRGEKYKVLERSGSQSSLKLEKRSSSRTEIDKLGSNESDSRSPNVKDPNESKIRNGIVITKDKSGKLLAEQLPAVKSKRRDNVFENFNDVGYWKVLASPRDRPNDILKLKLSPHKPARIESTMEEACAFSAAKYLDIPVDSAKLKGEVSGEDSDILELLPSYDKETDGGMNNVNDSGIEVLSSSSCNRSNGNSVRSVINDDNSPTYFNTEDSVFSLDSPDIANKSEHSICHKCGGIIMETNNNAQSPGHCRCNASEPNSSFSGIESPIKINLVTPERLDHINIDNASGVDDLQSNMTAVDKSDSEDSDIMILSFSDKPQSAKASESRAKLKLKLKSKDSSKSSLNVKEKSKSPQKLNPSNSLPPHIGSKSEQECVESVKTVSTVPETSSSKTDQNVNRNNKQNEKNGKGPTERAISDKKLPKVTVSSKLDNNSVDTAIVVNDNNDSENISGDETVQSSDTKCAAIDSNKQTRKKPLFKTQRSKEVKRNSLNEASRVETCKETSEKTVKTKEEKVQNKKPLFKKRTLSADVNVGVNAKKPCFNTQKSVPAGSSRETQQKTSTDHVSKIDSSLEETVSERKNLACRKSVGKLSTVGVDDDDSLQQFSNEIIPDVEKSEPSKVKATEKPAASFDFYQKQFLSFISNTINSSKTSKSKDEKSDKTEEKNEDSAKLDSNTNKSVEKDKETVDNSCVQDDNIQSEQKTVKNEQTDNKESKYTKVTSKRVRTKVVRVTKNVDGSTAGIKRGTFKVSNVKSSSNLSKNDTVEKENTMKTESEIADSKNKLSASELKVTQRTDLTFEESKGESLKSQTTTVSVSEKGKDENESTSAKCESAKNRVKSGGEKTVKLVKPDSFSWLSIFSEKATNNSSENKKESSTDVMTDLSENLAEINKKIDVSEDDDTHSLDMDDVFQMDKLSSLEPKHEINFCKSQTDRSLKDVRTEMNSGSPYKRKQTAKRTRGKFNVAKRKVESESEHSNQSWGVETAASRCSHQDSDPDFNPFNDSDDDFVKAPRKRRDSRTCVRTKRSHVPSIESSDSCDSDMEKLDTESQSSRSRRTKRKSCCPCCIGSPRKRSRDHAGDQELSSQKDNYKLPRKHKQFVKSTLRLLQLQEKIHSLFLTLFPDCAEIITRSNIGTDEFESLIDDVLCGLEEKVPDPSSELNSIKYIKPHIADNEFNMCPVNNIEMPFTASGSATRTSEIDLVNTSGEENGGVTPHAHDSQNILHTNTTHTLHNKHDVSTAGNQTDTGMSWQHTPLYSQSLITQGQSSSSLKFENNTITDNDENMDENTDHNTPSAGSDLVICEPPLAFTQDSLTDNSHYHIVNNGDLMNIGSAAHLGMLDDPGLLSNIDCLQREICTMPLVQNEITITLDLNASRVSLCRSPNRCLEKLQNQIVKLTKVFLPKLEFKNYFYRNMDNLEFMLDLMIKANSGETIVESENEMVEESVLEKWHIPSNNMEILETSIIKEDDTVKVNFFGVKSDQNSEERESLFVKCSDLFEQEIKNQRESLKKDVFNIDEDKPENTWKSAEEVISSIKSLKKMAKQNQIARRARRPRDSRLRKRSADEKRTLFVREKLQNSQNSTFVCDTRTRSGNKVKTKRKKSRQENSKKRFLSELNLGDKLVEEEEVSKAIEETSTDKINGHVLIPEQKDQKIPDPEEVLLKNNIFQKAEITALNEQNKIKNATDVIGDIDFLHKGDKNIFELMQPS